MPLLSYAKQAELMSIQRDNAQKLYYKFYQEEGDTMDSYVQIWKYSDSSSDSVIIEKQVLLNTVSLKDRNLRKYVDRYVVRWMIDNPGKDTVLEENVTGFFTGTPKSFPLYNFVEVSKKQSKFFYYDTYKNIVVFKSDEESYQFVKLDSTNDVVKFLQTVIFTYLILSFGLLIIGIKTKKHKEFCCTLGFIALILGYVFYSVLFGFLWLPLLFVLTMAISYLLMFKGLPSFLKKKPGMKFV